MAENSIVEPFKRSMPYGTPVSKKKKKKKKKFNLKKHKQKK